MPSPARLVPEVQAPTVVLLAPKQKTVEIEVLHLLHNTAGAKPKKPTRKLVEPKRKAAKRLDGLYHRAVTSGGYSLLRILNRTACRFSVTRYSRPFDAIGCESARAF